MAAVLRPSKITEEEWDRYKDIIVSLYLGIGPKECERVQDGESQLKGQTLDELAESMRVVHGFTAR
jgi:hypothetical protein